MKQNDELRELETSQELRQFFDNLLGFKKYLFILMNEKKDNTISEIYFKLDGFFKEKK